MEFFLEAPANLEFNNSTFKTENHDLQNATCLNFSVNPPVDENEIIDVSKLIPSDDENWLLESATKSETDLKKWLTNNDEFVEHFVPRSELSLHRDFAKNIDTRTFTRPKKRFTRPSIEKYNEELYGSDLNSSLTDSGIQMNGCFSDESRPLSKPLDFDLAQPLSGSYYFDNIVAGANMADSFQNMSPPSLVNSMCSSTFANLMENSFIKNDPVLREIRDTDFTGVVLQQESEPMFQSITESCTSLSSDVPENLLKKLSFEDKSQSLEGSNAGSATLVLNSTFAKEDDSPNKDTIILHYHEDFEEADTNSEDNLNKTFDKQLNGTFNKKVDSTFNKISDDTFNKKHEETFIAKVAEIPNKTQDVNNASFKAANSTFQRRKSHRLSATNSQESNATVCLESHKSNENISFERVRRLLDRRPSPSFDLNRISYEMDKNEQLNESANKNQIKRNSIESSDSTENLDYMSLSSGSSRSSSKILSMDGINTIADMQEKNLQAVMSTPKPRNKSPSLWQNDELSPISGRNSDPELSSSEKSLVKPVIAQNLIKKQKSMGHIGSKMPLSKSPNALSQISSTRSSIRGSQPNLIVEEKRSGLRRPTNLNSMGHVLKGSYTSLRPMNSNLPVAPPPLNTTVTKAQLASTKEDTPATNAQFVKPQPVRASGLPRPVTGIPRPASRIPAPRSNRPAKSASQQGRQTNHY